MDTGDFLDGFNDLVADLRANGATEEDLDRFLSGISSVVLFGAIEASEKAWLTAWVLSWLGPQAAHEWLADS